MSSPNGGDRNLSHRPEGGRRGQCGQIPCRPGTRRFAFWNGADIGGGVVEKVGSAVTRVVKGDKALLSFNSCGNCKVCERETPAYCNHCLALNFGGTRLDGTHTASIDGKPLYANFFGQSSLSHVSVVNERSVIHVWSWLMNVRS